VFRETFHALKSILKEQHLATSVGDEGGFAPNLTAAGEAVATLVQAIEKAAGKVFESLKNDHAKHVIIDLFGTDYYGSTALGFFVKLWKRVRDHGGRMAFCNMSAHELEVLKVTKLDTLWPLCENFEAAIVAIRSGAMKNDD